MDERETLAQFALRMGYVTAELKGEITGLAGRLVDIERDVAANKAVLEILRRAFEDQFEMKIDLEQEGEGSEQS